MHRSAKSAKKMPIERKAVPIRPEPKEGAISNDADVSIAGRFQIYFDALDHDPGFLHHHLQAFRGIIARGYREHKKTLDKALWKYAKVSEGSGLPRLLFRTGKCPRATCCCTQNVPSKSLYSVFALNQPCLRETIPFNAYPSKELLTKIDGPYRDQQPFNKAPSIDKSFSLR